MDIAQALKSLIPNSEFSIEDNDYNKIIWYDWNELPIPSKEEVEAEIIRLQNQNKNTEYKKLREKEYPDFREYLDGLVKGDTSQIQAYIDACLAVKAKYPKPDQASLPQPEVTEE
jgi:hypothetical protein